MHKKTTKSDNKRGPGGPTKYKPSYAKLAQVAIEEGGFSINGLCRLFGVRSRSTIYLWMETHKKFSDAIKKGRKHFEGTKIHKALVKRAVGFRYTETTRERNAEGQMQITKKVSKMVVPDVPAIRYYQNNVDPDNWRDKQDIDVSAHGDFSINWIVEKDK